MSSNIRIGAASLAALALICCSAAQEKPPNALIDARSAIRQIMANDPEAKIEAMENSFAARLRAYCDHSDEESPQTAAKQWLALVDEAIALPHRSNNGGLGGFMGGPPGSLENLLIALPRPEAWPEIEVAVKKHPPSLDRTVLLLLSARLNGDNEGVLKLCDEFDSRAPHDPKNPRRRSPTLTIRLAAMHRMGKLLTAEAIEQAIDLGTWDDLELPPLLDLMPVATAKALVLKVLQQPEGVGKFWGAENRSLAKQVVLENLDALPIAAWGLARDWGDRPYVQKLVEHYGYLSLARLSNQSGSADDIYFRDLARKGKLEDAARYLNASKSVPRLNPQDWGTTNKPDQFVLKLQDLVGQTDLTTLYVSAAIAAGRVPEAIKSLQSRLSIPSLPHDRQISLLREICQLHGRLGDVEALAHDIDAAERIPRIGYDNDPAGRVLEMALALGDTRLIERGIAHELKDSRSSPDGDLVEALLNRSDFRKIEELELRQVEREASETPSANVAGALCALYFRANRPRDILALLKKFPNWYVSDLGGLIEREYSGIRFERDNEDSQPTGFYAAWALSQTAQNTLAIRLLRNLILGNCDLPFCYELLNQIGGASSLEFYDGVGSLNPFDPLPILWKGDLLFRLGKTADAEICINAAKALDPVGSFGYREKLYDLQEKILGAKGEYAGAHTCALKVSAINLASRATELEKLGLVPQAGEALSQAVAFWRDDPALQVQLARCLESDGRSDEASAHYRNAYRYIVSGLGAASGEETLLDDLKLSEFGIETLNKIIIDKPAEAKAFYARGRLLQLTGQTNRAFLDFQKALAIDPGYIEARSSLATFLMTPKEAEGIEFQLMDLGATQPFGYSAHLGLPKVSNLGKAYRTLKARLRTCPNLDTRPLFPLHSSDGGRRLGIGIIPRFDALDPHCRLVGWYFQQAADIRDIVRLYHTTNYPFD